MTRSIKPQNRLLFLGNNERSLQALLRCNVCITAAVHEAGHDLTHTGLCDEQLLQQGGKVIEIPKDDQQALHEVLKEFRRPDLCLVSFFTILSKRILDFPFHGCLNIHPSLLPYYKGPHPIKWALINGESTIGITFMDLMTKIDTGGIYKQIEIPVHDDDNTLTLLEKVNDTVDKHLPAVIEGVLEGTLSAQPQTEPGSYYPKLTPAVRFINFKTMTARDIHNITRSQVKYGGSISTFRQRKIIFGRSRIVEEHSVGERVGRICTIDLSESSAGLVVQSIKGTVELYTRSKRGKLLHENDILGT